jgi:hypothetical protein
MVPVQHATAHKEACTLHPPPPRTVHAVHSPLALAALHRARVCSTSMCVCYVSAPSCAAGMKRASLAQGALGGMTSSLAQRKETYTAQVGGAGVTAVKRASIVDELVPDIVAQLEGAAGGSSSSSVGGGGLNGGGSFKNNGGSSRSSPQRASAMGNAISGGGDGMNGGGGPPLGMGTMNAQALLSAPVAGRFRRGSRRASKKMTIEGSFGEARVDGRFGFGDQARAASAHALNSRRERERERCLCRCLCACTLGSLRHCLPRASSGLVVEPMAEPLAARVSHCTASLTC